MQDVGCFGRIRSETDRQTDRQQARARAERVNESTGEKGQFGVISGGRTRAVVVCEACRSARDGPEQVGGRQGKESQ